MDYGSVLYVHNETVCTGEGFSRSEEETKVAFIYDTNNIKQ